MVLRVQRLVLAGLLLLSPSALPAQSEGEDQELPSDAQEETEDEGNAAATQDSAADQSSEAEPEENSAAPAASPAAPEPSPTVPEPSPVVPENSESEPSPDVPATDTTKADDKESRPALKDTDDSPRRAPGAYFGLGLGKVTDLGKYNHYKIFYGSEKNMMLLHSGYYFFTKVVDFGASLKLGYYQATGHPLASLASLGGLQPPIKEDLPANTVTDPNQKLELTLIPAQLLLNLAYSPFYQSRRLVLRGWFGVEFLRVEETLSADIPPDVSNSGVSKFTQSGWNQGVVTGGMLSISLSGLEPRSDYALRSMGIDRVYLSPFFEIVTTTDDKMGNYDRKTYGILIDFEGLR